MNIQAHIEQIKKETGIKEVLFGVGYPYDKPHILYYHNDGLNSWYGYIIRIFPHGDSTGKPSSLVEHRGS